MIERRIGQEYSCTEIVVLCFVFCFVCEITRESEKPACGNKWWTGQQASVCAALSGSPDSGKTGKFDPISTDLRQRLHWLPVEQTIQYKLGLLVYKCLHGLATPYLSSMLTPVSSNRYSCRLRSAARGDLTVTRTRSVRMGPRSFAVSGPELWNSLAPEIKNPSISLDTFKSLLKTELFKRAYPVG